MHQVIKGRMAALAVVVVGTAVCVTGAASQNASPLVAVQGNTSPALSAATLVEHKDPNSVMDIVVGLKMRNEKELNDLIARLYDPKSPDFLKFITPTDFDSRFAPVAESVGIVQRHLESNGLSVLQVASNNMLIHARGSVSQIEQAFSVKINDYDLNGEHHFSNDRDPSLPANVRNVVQSVMGLSSLEKLKRATAQSFATVSYTPAQIATAYDFPNTNNAFYWNKNV